MAEPTQLRRLEKIEDKLDKLTEAIVSIARIEERVATVLKQNDRFFVRFDKLESRLDEVETKTARYQNSLAFTERFVWTLITAGVGLVAYYTRF
jgi:tetrahydromethanopterin S-methyltransferase subunit G